MAQSCSVSTLCTTALTLHLYTVRAIACVGDVAVEEDMQRCVADTMEAFGRIDVNVNCAGNEIFLCFVSASNLDCFKLL